MHYGSTWLLLFYDFIEFKFHKTMFCSGKNNPILLKELNRSNHFPTINNVSINCININCYPD